MKKRIAFDFDGVIADTETKKINWIKKNLCLSIDYANKSYFYRELTKYYTYEQVDCFYKKMAVEIFTDKILFKTKPLKNSIKTLKILAKYYEIYIITARPTFMFKSLNKWLKKYHLSNCITKIISSSNSKKQEICINNNIDLLCDDDIRHLEDNIITNRIHFNSNFDKNNKLLIKVVNNWKDIYNLLIGGELDES